MKKIRFYFFAVLFFLQIIWRRITGKKEAVIAPPSTGVNLLDEGEVNLTPKPSQADALANKAKFGMGQIPEEHKAKVIWGIILAVFFLLFGVANFIYWLSVIIKAYPLVGWVLLDTLCGYIIYRIGKAVYNYFKERKYEKLLSTINEIWTQAKQKSNLKFKTEF